MKIASPIDTDKASKYYKEKNAGAGTIQAPTHNQGI